MKRRTFIQKLFMAIPALPFGGWLLSRAFGRRVMRRVVSQKDTQKDFLAVLDRNIAKWKARGYWPCDGRHGTPDLRCRFMRKPLAMLVNERGVVTHYWPNMVVMKKIYG